MSERALLLELLDGVVVEWIPLGSIVRTVTAPAKIKRSEYQEMGENPIVDQGIEYVAGFASAYVEPVPKNEYIVFGDHSEHIKYVDFSFVQGADGLKILHQTGNNTKFIYYAFQNFYKKQSGYKRHWLTAKATLIPIPSANYPEKSLAIQAEIVRILDSFTELTADLTADLTAELSARKKQYSYYRDRLLGFKEGEVEWKSLGELSENLDSLRRPITSNLRESGEIPYYGASGIVDYVNDFIFDEDLLLVSEDGANLIARKSPIAFSVSGKTWVNNHAHVLRFNSTEERRYIEYYLNSIDLTPYISGAAQPKLNKRNLNGIKIPNPSRKNKAHIVAILDKLGTLTQSFSEHLPREIELRLKQYEYYRNLLLSFPKPDDLSEAVA